MAQPAIFLIMGIAFLGIGSPIAFTALPQELPRGNYATLVVLLFPVIGLGLLIAFLRAWLARQRYGKCVFEMPNVPRAASAAGCRERSKPANA